MMGGIIQRLRQYNWKNWWYYHWVYVLIAVLLVTGTVWFLSDTVFRSDSEPDYHVGYVSSVHLPPAVAEQLEQQLAELVSDCNGDGTVLVELHDYVLDSDSDGSTGVSEADLSYLYQLTADGSYVPFSLWIVEKPESFQQKFELLEVQPGGSFGLPWNRSPVMTQLQLTAEGADWQTLLGEHTLCEPWTGGDNELCQLILTP